MENSITRIQLRKQTYYTEEELKIADYLSRYPLEEIPSEEENDPVSQQGHVTAVTTRLATRKPAEEKSQMEQQKRETSTGKNNNWNKTPINFIDDDILREHQHSTTGRRNSKYLKNQR